MGYRKISRVYWKKKSQTNGYWKEKPIEKKLLDYGHIIMWTWRRLCIGATSRKRSKLRSNDGSTGNASPPASTSAARRLTFSHIQKNANVRNSRQNWLSGTQKYSYSASYPNSNQTPSYSLPTIPGSVPTEKTINSWHRRRTELKDQHSNRTGSWRPARLHFKARMTHDWNDILPFLGRVTFITLPFTYGLPKE